MRAYDDSKLAGLIRHWTVRRKAALLEALRDGELTIEQARERYALFVEEIRSWERELERHGLHGLRATRLQIYPCDKDKGSD
jgi:Protein of unknown function (DUF1153)